MSLYLIAKYLHVLGALSTFVALGLEWASLTQLRRAQSSEQVREWARVQDWLRWLGPLSLAAILIPGIYMMVTVWKGATWIAISFPALVIIGLLGALGARRGRTGIKAAIADDGRLSATTRALLRAPLPWISVQARAALLLAIVYVMIAKADLSQALWAMAVAALMAAAGSVPGRQRPIEGAVTRTIGTPSGGD